MKSDRLENMFKGWFVGNFTPTVLSTEACEVALKEYKAGDKEEAHYHKVATEITLIVSGMVKMNEKVWSDGDIIRLEPNEITNFEALTDTLTVVVKTPGAQDDKYVVES